MRLCSCSPNDANRKAETISRPQHSDGILNEACIEDSTLMHETMWWRTRVANISLKCTVIYAYVLVVETAQSLLFSIYEATSNGQVFPDKRVARPDCAQQMFRATSEQ